MSLLLRSLTVRAVAVNRTETIFRLRSRQSVTTLPTISDASSAPAAMPGLLHLGPGEIIPHAVAARIGLIGAPSGSPFGPALRYRVNLIPELWIGALFHDRDQVLRLPGNVPVTRLADCRRTLVALG
jgi:hypothetical protein